MAECFTNPVTICVVRKLGLGKKTIGEIMKRSIIIILGILLMSAAHASPAQPQSSAPTPIYSYGKGNLYKQDIPGSDKFIIIADLHGTYQEMGAQYGAMLGMHSPYNLLGTFYRQLTNLPIERDFFIKNLYHYIILPIAKRHLPERQMELIAAAATTSGMSIDELVLLDQTLVFTFLSHLPEQQRTNALAGQNIQTIDGTMAPGCSTLGVWGNFTKNKQLLIGRNFDWAKNAHIAFNSPFTPCLLMVTVYHPTDENGRPIANSIATLGYPGWFCLLSGMNDKGLFLELNSGIFSSYGLDFFSDNSPQTYFDALANILFDVSDYKGLKNAIANSKPNLAYIMVGADGKTKQMFVTEEIATPKAIVRMRLPGYTPYYGYEEIDPTIDENMLAVSNSFRLAGWEKIIKVLIPYPYLDPLDPAKDDETAHPLLRYNNLLFGARKYRGKIDVDTMKMLFEKSMNKGGGPTEYDYDMLHSRLIGSTFYSIIVNPTERKWYVRQPSIYKGQPGDAWVTIDLNQFFE